MIVKLENKGLPNKKPHPDCFIHGSVYGVCWAIEINSMDGLKKLLHELGDPRCEMEMEGGVIKITLLSRSELVSGIKRSLKNFKLNYLTFQL